MALLFAFGIRVLGCGVQILRIAGPHGFPGNPCGPVVRIRVMVTPQSQSEQQGQYGYGSKVWGLGLGVHNFRFKIQGLVILEFRTVIIRGEGDGEVRGGGRVGDLQV